MYISATNTAHTVDFYMRAPLAPRRPLASLTRPAVHAGRGAVLAEETFAEVDAVSVTAEAEAEMEAWAADVAMGSVHLVVQL